jgi:surface carbohydrate biosynthesis protein (TIGR04326 family)
MASQYLRYGRSASDAVVVAADEDDEIVVVDYFDNFTVDRDGDDPYVSNYWGPLPAELARRAKPVHWIHIDVRSARLATVAAAREATLELNRASSVQRHSLLQDRIDFWLILQALRTYGHLVLLGARVDHLKVQWRHKRSAMDMRPLVNDAWSSAFLGVDAAQNALWLHLFKTLTAEESASPMCLYLMENQPWELAMLHAWKTQGRAETAGVVHSTVRTWDLRYALGTQSISSATATGLPRPDVILANGPLARRMLEGNGSQALELRSVEALRYMDLAGSRTQSRARVGGSMAIPKLLVIGEYDPSMQAAQVSFIAELLRSGSLNLEVIFRPHPSASAPLMPADVPVVVSSTLTMAEDLARSDVVLCGEVSSGIADAVLAGVPVIVLRDARHLGGQFLPRNAMRLMVDSPGMFPDALALALSPQASPSLRISDIFYVDQSLMRWSIALDLDACA